MSARLTRNNVKAGIFVVGGAVILLLGLMKVGNFWGYLFEKRTHYVFRFTIEDGAAGLKKGSMVKVGGQPVGEVLAVTFARPEGATVVPLEQTAASRFARALENADPAQPDKAIFVRASMNSDIEIFRNAKVYLELPLLGSVSTINIPDLGGGEYFTRAADAKDVKSVAIPKLAALDIIPGTLAPPSFLGQAGYGAEQKEQLQVILQRGSEISNQVKEMVSQTQGTLKNTMASVEEAAKNMSEATGTVNKKLPTWSETITTLLERASSGADEFKQSLIAAKAVVATVQSAIDDNRQNLNRILKGAADTAENSAALTQKINDDLYQVVRDALVDGRKVMAKSADVVDQVNRLVEEKTPEFSRMIANARLASDQLKLTMTEVRRNPWRLLYQPTRREIEEELTYDAARTYAEAVGQLRASTEALEAVVAGSGGPGGPTPEQRKQLEAITGDIQASFKTYQDAERKFLDRLTREK